MPVKLNTKLGVSHLVIPDDHAVPGGSMNRYQLAANLIMERQPEVIIKIGDSWDMPSLCSYDAGKKSFVFKNVADDIEAGHEAEAIMFGPIVEYHNKHTRWKKKGYDPLIIKCIGNHENRLHKLLQYEPRWEGTLSMDQFRTRLPLREIVVPFLDFGVIDNIAYSHYFVSGTKGQPFSTASAMIHKKGMSCTMGHSHHLDHHQMVKPTGEQIRGLICGSYLEEDFESFAGTQVDMVWWKGLIYKHNVNNGAYDLEELHIRRLQQMYS